MTFDDSHHWIGETPDPGSYFGFLYEIVELDTGRRYAGMKYYWFSSGKAKNRAMDRTSSNWKQWHYKESDWRFYTSSSKDLQQAIKEKGKDNYEFIIIGQYENSRDLRYAEANHLHRVEALTLKENDEYVYYNKAIGAIRFRPPASRERNPAKEQARSQGQHHYWSDDPCPRGHIGMHRVHNSACVQCEAEWQKNRRAKQPRKPRKKPGERAKTYHGRPCKVCGNTERYVSHGNCILKGSHKKEKSDVDIRRDM